MSNDRTEPTLNAGSPFGDSRAQLGNALAPEPPLSELANFAQNFRGQCSELRIIDARLDSLLEKLRGTVPATGTEKTSPPEPNGHLDHLRHIRAGIDDVIGDIREKVAELEEYIS